MRPVVTAENGPRPNGPPDECFYCQAKLGEEHGPECVLVTRRVIVRATIEYPVEVPAHWDGAAIEAHRNRGTWCANNLIDELDELTADSYYCLCAFARFEYVGEVEG